MTFEAKRLGDVAEIIGGGTPSTKDAGNWDGDIPWLTPKDLSTFEGIYIDRGSRSITEQGFKTSSAKMLPTGAVLYTSRAPIGYVAIASNPISTNQGFKSLILKDGYVPEFVFYLLKASKSEIEAHASGGTFAEISAKALSDVVLRFPPKVQQQAISKLLKSLDEKIAANNAISKTLEVIAQTIFKSWFIDFDPVKAKMAGEKPEGMDAATAALFPNAMEESEVGLIPNDWELRKIEEVLKRFTVKGLPKSTVLLNLGRTLVLEQGDSVIAGFIDEDADVKATNDSPAFVFGDHTCRMRLSTIPFSVFPNTIVLTSEHINTYWAFGATWGLQNFETYRRHWMELAYKVLVVPNTEVADVYGEQVKPLFELIDSLMVQNRMLSAVRDDLLPRLISGELQIPEEMLAS
jgi:type I restriction enzyme, S subunit